MVHTFDLNGKIILITGGYGYLGKAITESLAFHGATVFVLGRSKEKFNAAFGEVKAKENIFFSNCDVALSSSIENVFKKIAAEQGRIDVLINNAFYSKGQSPEAMSDEDFALGIDGTLSNVFRCIKGIIPCFKKNGSGKIINVSSMYGMVSPDFAVYDNFPAYLNPPHYGAAKAGVIQLTKYYANFLGKDGITVNAVTPGPFPSAEVQKAEGFIEELKNKTALNKIGKPEDLAGAFVFLSSNASDFITGQNIIVDGGWTSK